MTVTTRRGLFGLLAGAAAAPYVAPVVDLLAAPAAQAYTHTEYGMGYAITHEDMSSWAHRHGITDPTIPGGVRYLWPVPGDPGYPEHYR